MKSNQKSILDFSAINRATLRFKDRERESAYQLAIKSSRNTQMRLAVFLVGILYCIFALMDHFVLPLELQAWASKIHLTQGVSFCLFIAFSFRFKSSRLLKFIVFISMSIAWMDHFIITFVGNSSVFFCELYFMLLWTWIVSGFSITQAGKYSLLYLSLFEILVYRFSNFNMELMLAHQLFILVSVALGGLGGYLVEYYKRHSFLSHEATVRAKEQLEEAIETKNKFFSIISHDLRGPIGSMSVILNEVAQRGADLNDATFAALASSAKNTNQLLENLLSWSRSQKGELVFNPRDFAIATPLQNNIDLFQSQAQQKKIQFTTDFAPNLFVHADFEMVNTIIRNLINNAIKFTPDQGKIQVITSLQAGMIQVEVIDNGVGILPDTMESLFKLDQKVQSRLGTSNESGSGLGLILCSEFVQRQGGRIQVESKVDRGSRFFFTLPIGKEDKIKEQNWMKQLKSFKVLVVEDNPLHQQSTSKALQNLNLEFTLAVDGPEAVAMAKKASPNLILMDIDLPGFNGDEAAKQILEQPSKAPLIIALTSYSKKECDRRFQRDYFEGFLSKPLNKDELMITLYPLLAQA